MKVTIRHIEDRDFPHLIDLFHEFAAFEKTPEKMMNSVSRMEQEKEYVNGFVAETADKEIIGYVAYFFCYFTWVGKSLYMDDLYVKPAYRGTGIGSAFVDKMIELAKTSGCRRLRWQVSHWNEPAIAFYKKLGAEIDPTESNCDLVFE